MTLRSGQESGEIGRDSARPSPRRARGGQEGGKPRCRQKSADFGAVAPASLASGRGPPARRPSPRRTRTRAQRPSLCAHARWLARRPEDLRSPPAPARPGGGADPAAASRSSYDVADPIGRHRGRRVLASLRVAGRSAHRELAHAPGHQARRGPDTASVSRKRAGRGRAFSSSSSSANAMGLRTDTSARCGSARATFSSSPGRARCTRWSGGGARCAAGTRSSCSRWNKWSAGTALSQLR